MDFVVGIVKGGRKQDCLWIAEQVFVMFELAELIGEGSDLLHLVVDHLDVFRDVLRFVENLLSVDGGVVNNPLRASRCRDANGHERECDELFHGVLSLRFIAFSGDTPPIKGDDLPPAERAKMYALHNTKIS